MLYRGPGVKPLLADILAHGVLEVSDAQVITFLAHAERLTIDEWLEILDRARELRACSESRANGQVVRHSLGIDTA